MFYFVSNHVNKTHIPSLLGINVIGDVETQKRAIVINKILSADKVKCDQ